MNLRKCVVCVIRNNDGAFLAGRRSDHPGVWQFPQGGIKSDESVIEAALREIMEEVAIPSHHLTKVKFAEETSKYYFPADMRGAKAAKYAGQELHWALFEFIPKDGFEIDISIAQDQEFSEVEWLALDDILSKVTEWKQDAYRDGVKILKLV